MATPTVFLAQLNVARARHDFDDARMAGFLALYEHVNAAADASPGFVWRLKDPSGTFNAGGEPREIVNLSVWESIDALRAFVFGGLHRRALARKAHWFEPPAESYLVMWHVPADHRPTLEEGLRRLESLRRHGPCAEVFGWETLAVPAATLHER